MIFTLKFPYGKGETFIEGELEVLNIEFVVAVKLLFLRFLIHATTPKVNLTYSELPKSRLIKHPETARCHLFSWIKRLPIYCISMGPIHLAPLLLNILCPPSL